MNVAWKRRVRQIICGLAVCMVAVLALPGMESEAAANKPACVKKQTVYLTKSDLQVGPEGPIEQQEEVYYLDGTELSSYIFIRNLSNNAKITNIKSSNKKITVSNGLAAPGVEKGKYLVLNGVNCKPGEKSTITFRVKQNGKTYKLSCKITLKLKPSNFKTFSIGGENYASNLKGYSGTGKVASLSIRPLEGTFKIKMVSGVKLDKVQLVRTDSRGKVSAKTMKNGSKVTLKEGDTLQISYKYTKKPANYNFTYNKSAAIPGVYTLQRGGSTVINVK